MQGQKILDKKIQDHGHCARLVDAARMRSRVYETAEHSSVCPINQQQQRREAGLLLGALEAGDIYR